MKLPGEAWLEFKIEKNILYQTATFRPKGVAGRLYWYLVTPLHWFVFNGMINRIIKTKQLKKQHLPVKYCAVCEKPFNWRKKWKKNWEQVKYCSERCRRNKR